MDMLFRLFLYFGVTFMFYIGLHLFIEYVILLLDIKQLEKQNEQD
jgi:hypothetical protein